VTAAASGDPRAAVSAGPPTSVHVRVRQKAPAGGAVDQMTPRTPRSWGFRRGVMSAPRHARIMYCRRRGRRESCSRRTAEHAADQLRRFSAARPHSNIPTACTPQPLRPRQPQSPSTADCDGLAPTMQDSGLVEHMMNKSMHVWNLVAITLAVHNGLPSTDALSLHCVRSGSMQSHGHGSLSRNTVTVTVTVSLYTSFSIRQSALVFLSEPQVHNGQPERSRVTIPCYI